MVEHSDQLVIGKITGVYGVKGWVKVHSFTEPMDGFLGYSNCLIHKRQGWEPIDFDAGRRQGKGLVVHIKGVDDRNAAEAYIKSEVAIAAGQLDVLPEGDYYWRQLQGLEVWSPGSKGRELLGKVAYLVETGANDVLVVQGSAGSIDDRERLIPYLPDRVVTHIDLDAGYLDVNWDKEF